MDGSAAPRVPSPLLRWAAGALILSAALTVTGFVLHPPAEPAAMTGLLWALSHAVLWIGGAAAIAGLGGLYLRQAGGLGLFGAVGAGLAGVGLAGLSSAYFFEAVVIPGLAADAPALVQTFPRGTAWGAYPAVVATAGVLVAVGYALFGAAMYRAAMLPRWAIILASLGAAAAGLQFLLPRPIAVVAFVILGIGLTGLGSGLWRSVARPGPDADKPGADKAALLSR